MDNNTARLIVSVAGIAAIERMKTLRLKRKNAKLVQENESLKKLAAFSLAQATYYASMLDRHGVTPTEFDKIALSEMIQEHV